MARSNGEGTIFKRKDGRWCGQVTLGSNPETGKPIRPMFYGRTRREVKKKMRSLLDEYSSGIDTQSDYTLMSWIDQWLEVYKRPNIRPRTYESYDSIARNHISKIGHIKLKEIRSIDLRRFLNSYAGSGLSEHTVDHIKIILKSSLEQAARNQIIRFNPATYIEIPNDLARPKTERALTVEERLQLEAVLPGAFYEYAIILAMDTGLRRGEVLGLKWADIDLINGFINIKRALVETNVNGHREIIEGPPKTRAGERELPLTDRRLNALKAHKLKQIEKRLRSGGNYTDNDIVFATRSGGYTSPNNLSRAFKTYCKKAGIEGASFKTLRHTFATRLAESDIHLTTAQSLMGHASSTTTANIYTHTLSNTKKAAIRKIE